MSSYKNTIEFAREMDLNDPISRYRELFYFPVDSDGHPMIYFCGNSLGLQPKSTFAEVNDVLRNWQKLGVEGHFEGENPWINYNKKIKPKLAKMVGAQTDEVVIMNTLTVNLHLMMLSFYRPTNDRYKILIESDAFPSDKYAVHSQAKYHGYDPDEAVIEVRPSGPSSLLQLEQIHEALRKDGKSVALVLLSGVNYFTGQVFPIRKITEIAHSFGCKVGFDLAHAIGNIPLQLHDDQVDFAVWCHYKYLNAGPGAIAGAFVHQKQHKQDVPRLEGWWGNKLSSRFDMANDFDPEIGAEAWVMSTPPTLAIAPLRTSLDLFDAIGMTALRKKSILLTGYLEYLINHLGHPSIEIITPQEANERGCQMSIRVKNANKRLYQNLMKNGIILDWREPDVIRVSPAPIYNSFEDVFRFSEILRSCLN